MAHLISAILTLLLLIVLVGGFIGLVYRGTAQSRKSAVAPWKRGKEESDRTD